MPLPAPTNPRKPIHHRSIQVHSFEREDGLWDIEAALIDTKSDDVIKKDGSVRKAFEPLHHMHIRVTIDTSYTIHDAVVAYDAAPFGPSCTSIADRYRELIGMNLLKFFRQQIKERFGRTAGCTHMTELAVVLPTVAVQSMANIKRHTDSHSERKPFQLDGCHAWRLDSVVTKEHYPQWYVAPSKDAESPDS
jgi:hypothetical protein